MVKLVKALMALRGINQQTLAKDANVPIASLSRFMNGASTLRVESLFRLLAILGVDIESILKREVNRALGSHDNESIGEHLRIALNSLDPILRRTVLDTIITASKKNSSPEARPAISKIIEYRNSVRTVRRV